MMQKPFLRRRRNIDFGPSLAAEAEERQTALEAGIDRLCERDDMPASEAKLILAPDRPGLTPDLPSGTGHTVEPHENEA